MAATRWTVVRKEGCGRYPAAALRISHQKLARCRSSILRTSLLRLSPKFAVRENRRVAP